MQVSFSEEFGFYLQSQVEKSTRLGLREATVTCSCYWPTDNIQQATTSPLPPSATPPQPTACTDHKSLSAVSAVVGTFSRCWSCQGEQPVEEVYAEMRNLVRFCPGAKKSWQPPAAITSSGVQPAAQQHFGPLLGSRSIMTQIQATASAPSTVSSGSAREGLCQFLMGFSSISLVSLSSSSSPLSERITLPCQVRKSIPSPAGQTAPRPVFIFLDGICSPLCD